MIKNIAITTGEPAGIGIEISLKSYLYFINQTNKNNKDINPTSNITPNITPNITLIGCKNSMYKVAKKCNISDDIFNAINICDIPIKQKANQGELNKNNSSYVLEILDEAINGCLNNKYHAMVTAPIHKGIINEFYFSNNKQYKFSGHTEYLAEKTHTKNVIMLLTGRDDYRNIRLRIALATTHIPLNKVSQKITQDKVYADIICLNEHLKKYFSIKTPHIKISGINPHAGEGGYIGHEEQEILIPSIKKLQNIGIDINGPYAGDTMFLQPADCFYCMYHDQGLAPFKYATFGKGVNITLGLPIIRTSVDHGTAIDIADKYCADIDSMIEAINKAIFILDNLY